MTRNDLILTRDTSVKDPAAYDVWFRSKVQEALDDPHPAIAAEDVDAHFAKRRTKALRKLLEGGDT